MRYKILVLLVLLLPLAYAENLDAKQMVLDAKADDFAVQMNAVIEFANNRSISTEQFTAVKSRFTAAIQAALQTSDINEFQNKYKEAKETSKQFKELAKINFNSTSAELRDFIKTKKTSSEKYAKAEELLKQKIEIVFNQRIEQLNNYIAQQETAGKEAKLQKLLLHEFEEKLSQLNSTKILFSQETSKDSEFFPSMIRFFNAVKDRIAGEADE